MADRPQLSIVSYRQGMYIILEGNRDVERFFIIQKGSVKITKDGQLVQQESGASLGPGDFFGVVSAMSQRSRIETAQAMTDVTLVAVSSNQFEGLIQYNTPIAMKIVQQFSRRMRNLNTLLTNFTSNSIGVDDATSLFNVAEYYYKMHKYNIAAYAYKRFTQCYANDLRISGAINRIEELRPHDTPNYQSGGTVFVRQYGNEAPVFVEGESGDELFIIQSGSVKITKVTNGDAVILAILKPGDIFGEMAILESKPRSASAIAFEKCVLMIVQKRNFGGLSATQPQIISRLTQLLAERIWFSYKQIENAEIRNTAGRCYDYLLIQLERANFAIQPHVAYTFGFGVEELTRMASVPENEVHMTCKKVLENEKFSITGDGKLVVSDVSELLLLSNFYKKTQKRSGVEK